MATSTTPASTAIETKLYVTNFPSSATRQQLQQFFSRFGRVQECAIMWNSYAFVHYATIEEARRALEQSNGAMFLNRKLIVQLSTSRFRPQPKEINHFLTSKPLINQGTTPSTSMSYPHLNNTNDGGTTGTSSSTLALTQFSSLDVNNFEPMTNFNAQHSSPLTGANNYFSTNFRPPSPFHNSSQDITSAFYSPFHSLPIDRMTPSPLSMPSNKFNPIMKTSKSDVGTHGEIPKLYCTNLPDNCKANDLQRLFSQYGHVVDCVILWDYYAFVTFQNFVEAERALLALHGSTWQDRRLIVEWSRASGRRQQQTQTLPPIQSAQQSQQSSSAQQQQQQSSPSPPTSGFGSFASNLSTPPSPRVRPSTLLSGNAAAAAANGQFYGSTNSPTLLSPIKSQGTHYSNLSMMSAVLHHPNSLSNFPTYNNRNSLENLTNENHRSASSGHRLDLSPFVDTNDLTSPPSPVGPINQVYQPSDIVAFLEPNASLHENRTRTENSLANDITNTLTSTSTTTNLQTSCSSAAAAMASALLQENVLSSLFDSFEPFSKFFPIEESTSNSSGISSSSSSSSAVPSANAPPTQSRYHHHLTTTSPLLTTAPDHNLHHHPMYYGHTSSWH